MHFGVLLVEYRDYSNKQHLEGGAYFNVDTQKCGAY